MMENDPNDLVARILAENEKLNRLKNTLDVSRKALEEADTQLKVAHKKFEQDDFKQAFSYAKDALERYETIISSANDVNKAENSSADVEQLKKVAFDLIHLGQSSMSTAKQILFDAEYLENLQSDVEEAISAKNWVLIQQYSIDALKLSPTSAKFIHYAELATQNISQTQSRKSKGFKLPFRR